MGAVGRRDREFIQEGASGAARLFEHPAPCTPHAFETLLFPFGIRLAVETESPELLAAISRACRGWEGDADPTARPLRLKLILGHGSRDADNPTIRVRGPRIWISGSGVEASADAVSSEALCWITEDYLLNDEALRDEVLDPLVLFLLTRNGRTPIHAAGFLADDLAILLLGPSGAGKSCLALAAHETGYRLLSDDTVYVQSQPELRIWGIPRAIHVFPEDTPDGNRHSVRMRNGKLKHAVPVGGASNAVTARKAALCLLDHGDEVSLRRISQDEAMLGHGGLEPGFDLLRDEIEACLQMLTRNGAWRLTLSANPADAICLLGNSLSSFACTASP